MLGLGLNAALIDPPRSTAFPGEKWPHLQYELAAKINVGVAVYFWAVICLGTFFCMNLFVAVLSDSFTSIVRTLLPHTEHVQAALPLPTAIRCLASIGLSNFRLACTEAGPIACGPVAPHKLAYACGRRRKLEG